nr:SDR family oxidoreductase [Bacillus piscicola]
MTGATGGIGAATARTLINMGAALTITGRSEDKLSALQKQLVNSNGDPKIVAISADICNAADREGLVSAAEAAQGPVTMLVNNAGIHQRGKVEDVNEAMLTEIMHVNYTAAVLLSQQVYETMKKREKGAIVNVASLSGLRGTVGNTAYAASKFAMIGFTHCFALEAINHGIRVNAVCPGFVDTEMAEQVIRAKAASNTLSYEENREATEKGIPSGQITTPEEVANSIAFLLSDAAHNIVGESLKISGGGVLH